MPVWLEDLFIDSLVLKQNTNSDQPRVSMGNRVMIMLPEIV